ncbi:MAG: DUF4097 family beta strand repeat-containing protein [Planctomycetota bacterium]|jgi:DUF4097 and DUF4098 domain-containing protein YvlB
MTRSIGLAAVLVLPMTACSYSWNNNFKYRADTDLSLTADHIPGSALVVDTKNGRIEVIAEPQRTDVSIEARVRCRGTTQAEADERLAATTISITRSADQTLIVQPVFPGQRRGGEGASFSIKIPDANGLNLDTSNGTIVATGFSGHLRADTSNGSIRVTDHDGTAHVDTSNGGVTVTNLSGSLWADTSNGGITLTNVNGPVEADTSNGAIRLSLAGDQSGPLKLDTSNGAITVEVGGAFAGSVSFDTSNGAIHIEDQTGRISSSTLSRNEGRVTVGEGGPASRLDTSNGSIRFTIVG